MAKLKINYPTFRQPACVTFGSGSLRTLADLGALEQTAVFLSGRGEVREALAKVLDRCGHRLTTDNSIVKSPGEPTAEMVETGALLLEKGSFQRILGIGGGSVLDWCRLAWAASEGLLDLDTGRIADIGAGQSRPQMWLIPTTCGTGAEAASVAVYSHQGRKVPVVSPAFLADRVILDGRFLDSVPPAKLACFLSDALSHGIESYLSIVPNYLAKEMGLAAVRMILAQYHVDPTSSRHERLMEAGYLGGVAASNCSVGVIHAFAHSVSAWGIGHGLGNALGMTAGLETNADTPAMQELLQRLQLGGVGELVAKVRPVVGAAISAQADLPVTERLRDSAGRQEVIQGMMEDVCLRSNPQSLNSEQVDAFLNQVIDTVETLR